MPRGLTPDQRLKIDIELDTKGLKKGSLEAKKLTAKMTAEFQRANKATRRGGQAFQQLAYALDDIQYGFRGVQNNLQQLAISMGVSGPIVLGITALGIGLNYLISNWDKFGDAAQKAISSAFAGNQGGIAQAMIFAQVMRDATVGTDQHTYALQRLKDLGYDPAKESLAEFLRLQEKKILLDATEKAGAELISEELGNIVKKRDLLKRFGEGDTLAVGEVLLRGGGNVTTGINRISSSISKSKDRIASVTQTIADEITGILGQDGLVGFISRGKSGSKSGKKGFVAFNSALSGGFTGVFDEGFKIGDLFVKGLGSGLISTELVDPLASFNKAIDKASEKTKEKLKKLTDELNAQLSGILAGGIADFASALGEGLAAPDDLGKNLLAGIGKLMVAFGTALIAWGTGWKFFREAPANPTGAIVAGAILVAAGAAIAAVASQAGSQGGRVGSQARSAASAAAVNVSSTQGSGSTTGWIAVRGQDLRYIQQAASDSYRGLN